MTAQEDVSSPARAADWSPKEIPGGRSVQRLAEYQRLLETCPVAWSDDWGGFWSLTKYNDVKEAARQPGKFASGAPIIMWPDFKDQIPISLNPPLHATYRRLLNRYISKDALARLEPTIRGYVVEHVEPMIGSGEGDIISGLCQPLPARALAALLNLPDSAYEDMVEQFRGFERLGWDPDKINAVIGQVFESAVAKVVEERRARPLDPETDMLSGILAAKINGEPLSDHMVTQIGVQMFVAGHATTADALATMMYRLATNPDVQMELRLHPEKIPLAVEEFLRIETPLQDIARTATEDIEVNGRTIRAGDRVALNFAAADRDSEVFEHPSALIIDRQPNDHMAFGSGIHKCYGAPLARMEMRLTLEEILARTTEIALAGAGKETVGRLRGFVSLPLRFAPS